MWRSQLRGKHGAGTHATGRAPRQAQVGGRLPLLAALLLAVACGDATAPTSDAPDVALGEFRSPLAGDVPVSNVFDHDVPREFAAGNGYLVSFWGEHMGGIDGHNGYDFGVPVGTPVLAAAAGRIRAAGPEVPFTCPILGNATVSGLWVEIVHVLPSGERVVSQYGHFSRIDVAEGQRVTAGQQLGLSGSTGCSTGPHLHFSTYRTIGTDSTLHVVDPFGWTASGTDPWTLDPAGAPSPVLWTTQAPALYGGLTLASPFAQHPRAAITAFRFWGVDDAHHPNNEYIDIRADPATPTLDVSGWSVSTLGGARFDFPAGATLQSATSTRLYSGSGTGSATVLYWGQPSGVLGNTSDCVTLRDAAHAIVFQVSWRGAVCPAAASASVVHADVSPASDARAGPD